MVSVTITRARLIILFVLYNQYLICNCLRALAKAEHILHNSIRPMYKDCDSESIHTVHETDWHNKWPERIKNTKMVQQFKQTKLETDTSATTTNTKSFFVTLVRQWVIFWLFYNYDTLAFSFSGETDENAASKIQGQMNTNLNECGVNQVKSSKTDLCSNRKALSSKTNRHSHWRPPFPLAHTPSSTVQT